MTDRIVGFKESDWPAARDAIQQVRRGAMEHPFYRRRGPVVDGQASVAILQYIGSGAFLAAYDGTGLTDSGTCNDITNGISGVTCSGVYLTTVVPPDGFLLALVDGDEYTAMCGGVCYLAGPIVSTGVGSFAADAGGGGTITVATYADVCNNPLFDGQYIKTIVRVLPGSGIRFDVVDNCCPPVT